MSCMRHLILSSGRRWVLRDMRRPDRSKFDAVGCVLDDGIDLVVFECRCCGAQHIPGITKEEWLSDPDAEEPAPKLAIR